MIAHMAHKVKSPHFPLAFLAEVCYNKEHPTIRSDYMHDIRFLSGNALKIIAAITMLIDHIGVILYPTNMLLRIIGRLSMPLFAFMLAEGARYTKNKRRHLLLLFSVALICQIGLYIGTRLVMMSILVTFTIALILIYLLDRVKQALLSRESGRAERIFFSVIFLLACFAAWLFCDYFSVDYGFLGCMLPVFAALFDMHRIPNAPPSLRRLDTLPIRILTMFACLILLSVELGTLQFYSLLTLPLLLLYSGKRGRVRMKYFFYIFYPTHLVVLYGIALFL